MKKTFYLYVELYLKKSIELLYNFGSNLNRNIFLCYIFFGLYYYKLLSFFSVKWYKNIFYNNGINSLLVMFYLLDKWVIGLLEYNYFFILLISVINNKIYLIYMYIKKQLYYIYFRYELKYNILYLKKFFKLYNYELILKYISIFYIVFFCFVFLIYVLVLIIDIYNMVYFFVISFIMWFFSIFFILFLYNTNVLVFGKGDRIFYKGLSINKIPKKNMLKRNYYTALKKIDYKSKYNLFKQCEDNGLKVKYTSTSVSKFKQKKLSLKEMKELYNLVDTHPICIRASERGIEVCILTHSEHGVKVSVTSKTKIGTDTFFVTIENKQDVDNFVKSLKGMKRFKLSKQVELDLSSFFNGETSNTDIYTELKNIKNLDDVVSSIDNNSLF